MADGEKRRTRPARSPGARIGVISDTHGYLDPVVIGLFAGVSHISTPATSATPRSSPPSRRSPQ